MLQIQYFLSVFYLVIFFSSFLLYRAPPNLSGKKRSEYLTGNFFARFKLIYKYIQFSTLVACVSSVFSSNILLGKIFNFNQYTIVGGVIVCTIGITLFIYSKLTLGNEYSHCFDAHVPIRIISTGPYKYLRHPIYLANCILMLGLFCLSGSIIVLLNFLIVATYYIISAEQEERELLSLMAHTYSEYYARTWSCLPSFKFLTKTNSKIL